MSNHSLPLFPLKLVAFPGESLNLHIFEPRYRELVNDAMQADMRFGIPSFVRNTMEWGSEVEILEVVKAYDDGRKDIKTLVRKVFRIKNFQNPLPGKLYAAGIVEYVKDTQNGDEELRQSIFALVAELYALVQIEGVQLLEHTKMYDLGHKIGLSKEEEYELLLLSEERKRQEYVFNHLNRIIPRMKSIQDTKELIKLNGHFKHFDPLDF